MESINLFQLILMESTDYDENKLHSMEKRRKDLINHFMRLNSLFKQSHLLISYECAFVLNKIVSSLFFIAFQRWQKEDCNKTVYFQ